MLRFVSSHAFQGDRCAGALRAPSTLFIAMRIVYRASTAQPCLAKSPTTPLRSVAGALCKAGLRVCGRSAERCKEPYNSAALRCGGSLLTRASYVWSHRSPSRPTPHPLPLPPRTPRGGITPRMRGHRVHCYHGGVGILPCFSGR